jgi:hypothetical protein
MGEISVAVRVASTSGLREGQLQSLREGLAEELRIDPGELPFDIQRVQPTPGIPEVIYILTLFKGQLGTVILSATEALCKLLPSIPSEIVKAIISGLIYDGLKALVRRVVDRLKRTGDYPGMEVTEPPSGG